LAKAGDETDLYADEGCPKKTDAIRHLRQPRPSKWLNAATMASRLAGGAPKRTQHCQNVDDSCPQGFGRQMLGRRATRVYCCCSDCVALAKWQTGRSIARALDMDTARNAQSAPFSAEPETTHLAIIEVISGVALAAFGDHTSAAFQRAGELVEVINRYRPSNLDANISPQTNSLRSWSFPLPTQGQSAAPPALNGMTLIALDSDFGADMGHGKLSWLRQTNLARVVYPHPYRTDKFVEVTFNTRPDRERQAAVYRAKRDSIAIATVKKTDDADWRIKEFESVENGVYITGRIVAIEARMNEELNGRYAVFVNDSQLPPVPVSHAGLSQNGEGRYSIWERRILVSPPKELENTEWSAWMVPFSIEHAAAFDYVTRIFESRPQRTRIATFESVSHLTTQSDMPSPAQTTIAHGDKIVVCTHALPPGGAERQWYYLAKTLKEMNYDVSVVVYEPLSGSSGHYVRDLERAGVPLVNALDVTPLDLLRATLQDQHWASCLSLDTDLDFTRILRLATVFKSLAPKAVISQLDDPNLNASIAAHLAKIPRIVMSFRNYNPTHFPYISRPWQLPAYRALAQSGNVAFTGNNPDANNDYADWIGIDRSAVTFVPNAIDPIDFPLPEDGAVRAVREALQIQPDQPFVLGVFRLSAEKNPLLFLDVCKLVHEQRPDTAICIVGLGPLEAQMRQHIAALGMDSAVQLLGRRADVNTLMRAADVLLLTSEKEGMPNVVMEAQLMGTPVVATDVGGTALACVPGQSAFLAPPENPVALAQAVLRLLNNPDLRATAGSIGRSLALSFDCQKMARRYLEVLNPVKTSSADPNHAKTCSHTGVTMPPIPPHKIALQKEKALAQNLLFATEAEIAQFCGDQSHPWFAKMAQVKNGSMLATETLMLLRLLALHCNAGILEIGTYIGGASIAIGAGVRDGGGWPYVSIEPGGSFLEHPHYPSADILGDWSRHMRAEGLDQLVHMIPKTSSDADAISEVHSIFGPKGIGLFVVDADGEVERDFTNFGSLLASNAFVAIDDYVSPGAPDKAATIRPYIDSLVAKGTLTPVGIHGFGTWFGRWRG
jgi:glycosyltransferase involved in cell wall biosynthesis/predicted O-methyltransferase YrrM